MIYFLYTIFYKKIDSPVEQMKKDMKAKNVVYRLKDDAVIYADEQIGSNNDEVIKFKGVTIDLLKKEMILSAKEGEVNTKTSDIILKNEIVGRTKDDKWNVFTNHLEYIKEGDRLISKTRTKVLNNEKKSEFEADKLETTTTFEVITGEGNVSYKGEGRELKANKIVYNDLKQIAEAEGNIFYKDTKNSINANKGIYYIEKKQVDANGNVVYNGESLTVRANHVFYDEGKEYVNADGNGNFNYKPRNSNGTFENGEYDLKNEILTTNRNYTLNYDDYKMNGSSLIYLFKTGEATLNSKFNVSKQNFTVSGDNGKVNTIQKNIFANKMVMTSVQGDRVTSNIGEGSFEKREFKFDGNVNGKIRGNVNDLMNNPTKLVDSEAVHFKGNTAKIYFISHNNKNMSITRSEIKGNVNMIYKDINLDSQYNEIDTSKNLVLARDKVIVDFRNDTQMTSNFLYLDLNKEEGTAQNNVKIVSKLPKYQNINTSADKAIVDIKDKIVKLIGNVSTYQGKTRISSDDAIYNINKKILENTKNIKMQYEVQNNKVTQGKSDPKNVAAVTEIANKLKINQNEVNVRNKINLPKSMRASNGVDVEIKWITSDSKSLPITGTINKQFYGGSDKKVELEAIVKAGNDESIKKFNVIVPVESTKEMLERASKNVYMSENEKPSIVKVNVYNGMLDIPITWEENKGILKYNGEEYIKRF